MTWETREWQTTPNDKVMQQTRGGRLLGKRVRLTLDPRSFDTNDANDLRIEGTYMACMNDGPTILLEERDVLMGGRIPLIDVLCIEVLS